MSASPLAEKAEYVYSTYYRPAVTLLHKIVPKKDQEGGVEYSIRVSHMSLSLIDVYSVMNRIYDHGLSYLRHMTHIVSVQGDVENKLLQILEVFIMILPYEALKVYLSTQNDGNLPFTLEQCFRTVSSTAETMVVWYNILLPRLPRPDSNSLKEEIRY